jgi:hypothetical protein
MKYTPSGSPFAGRAMSRKAQPIASFLRPSTLKRKFSENTAQKPAALEEIVVQQDSEGRR